MRPEIPFLSLNEVKILALELLVSDHFNKFFSSKQLRDAIICKMYNIPERYLFTASEYSPLQKFLGKQLNHCFREFKELKYITKKTNRFWRIYKEKIQEDKRLNENGSKKEKE